MRPLRILFAGGGTGGHLFPAIAIAEKIRLLEPGAAIAFVGARDKIEARVVPEHGFAFHAIWISGFRRGFDLRNVLFPLKVIVSMQQANAILKSFSPDVVVGTGGYVAGPVLRTAVRHGIPALIQEQNSYPGVTTRLLAKVVDVVYITFEQSRKYLTGAKKIVLTGNPTRDSLDRVDRREALAHFGFSEESGVKTVLVLGGSLGAHSLNEAITGLVPSLKGTTLRIIWQTGSADLERAKSTVADLPKSRVWVAAFIEKMEYAYAACDIVVSRAGATTIAELTRLGKPAILVPYPHAAANHQFENARALAESGAARIVPDSDLGRSLWKELQTALVDEQLKKMGSHAKILGKPDAGKVLAEQVLAAANARRARVQGATAQ